MSENPQRPRNTADARRSAEAEERREEQEKAVAEAKAKAEAATRDRAQAQMEDDRAEALEREKRLAAPHVLDSERRENAHVENVKAEETKQAQESARYAAERARAAQAQAEAHPQPAKLDMPAEVKMERPDRPALGAMGMSELYDHLQALERPRNTFNREALAMELQAVVEGVQAAVRSQAPDYQEMACKLLLSPHVVVTLKE